jgi:trans-aconitate methyltransferase
MLPSKVFRGTFLKRIRKERHQMLGQKWNATDYKTCADYVPELGVDVLALLSPCKGEKILDLGCGDGVLTSKLLAFGAEVTGLEPDDALATEAEKKGLNIIRLDAHDLSMPNTFDAVFSNAAMHWMHSPEKVIANVATSLKSGGRFVVEQGGFGNVAALSTAILAALDKLNLPAPLTFPWDFPTPDQQTNRLEKAGFRVDVMQLFSRPTPLPKGIAGWLQTFIGPFVSGCSPEDKKNVIDYASELLKPILQDASGHWMADYVRLRYVAIKS